MTGSAHRHDGRAPASAAAPASVLEGLTVSVHLLNEALFALLFAKDDAQRAELVRAMSAQGMQLSVELMRVRAWLSARRGRAAQRATPARSALPAARPGGAP